MDTNTVSGKAAQKLKCFFLSNMGQTLIRWRKKTIITVSICSWLRWRRGAHHVRRIQYWGSMREAAKLAYSYKAFKITPPFIVRAASPSCVVRLQPRWHPFIFASTKIKMSHLCIYRHEFFCVARFFPFCMSHRHKTLTRRTWNLV